MKWKIYNRKGFFGGVLELALGLALPLTCAVKGWEHFELKDGILTVLLILLGIGTVLRSLNQEMSQEDWVEDHDERRRWIALRSQALCYRVLWWLLVAGFVGVHPYGNASAAIVSGGHGSASGRLVVL